MIAVVEGISAAGKTTWCRKAAPEHLLPELFPADRHNQPALGQATADYWTNWSSKRWADALALESSTGRAVCDTDPLKLHYAWGLWKIGAAPETQWEFSYQSTRAAIARQGLGFADLFLVKTIGPETARRQMERDLTRKRDRFELHLRLQEPLVKWYQTLGHILPGRVQWDLPSNFVVPTVAPNELRYDLRVFDELVAVLG